MRKLITASLVFDNGAFKDNLREARRVIDAVLSDMRIVWKSSSANTSTSTEDQLPVELQALVDVHQSVWYRITQGSSVGKLYSPLSTSKVEFKIELSTRSLC
jgi:hypothetical protein